MMLKNHEFSIRDIAAEAVIFGALAALPFLYLPSVTFHWTYAKVFGYEAAVFAAFAFITLGGRGSYKPLVAEGTGFMPALSLFFWAIFASAIAKYSWPGIQPLVEFLYIIAGIFTFSLVFSSEKLRRHFVVIYGAACSFVFIIYIITYSTSGGHMQVFPFGNPNIAAAFALVPLLAGVAAGISFLRLGKIGWAVFAFVVAAAAGGAILRSGSAAGTLAAAGGFLVLALILVRGRNKIIFGSIAAAVILASLIMIIFVPPVRSFASRQLGARPIMWRGTIELIKEKPLVGHGTGTFFIEFSRHYPRDYAVHPFWSNIVETAHSLPLHVFAELGIVGLLLSAWLIYEFAKITVAAYARSTENWRIIIAGIVAGSVAMLLQAMVSTELHYIEASVQLVLALALLSALSRSEYSEAPQPAKLWIRALIFALGLVVFLTTALPGLTSQVYLSAGRNLDAPLRESIANLEKSIKSTWPTAWTLDAMGYLAYQYEQVGRSDASLETLKRVDRLAPNVGAFRVSLAYIYIKNGEVAAAAEAISSYAQKDPFNKRAYLLWEEILSEAESRGKRGLAQPQKAVKLLEEAEKYDAERLPAATARELKKIFLPREKN